MAERIKRLSEQTINLIAAGEVVENPASVLKELVENAVDAGASAIHVEVRGGGFQSLRVSDNGCGMSREDATACLERHATSKIQDADDLMCLTTMGFRGEALAAIASISHLQILTAERSAVGTRVDVEGGRLLKAAPAARSEGTTIEVASLFYNVPARRKFQKSVGASTVEITKTVIQQALAHPERHFDLVVHGGQAFSVAPCAYSADGLAARSGELLGDLFQGEFVLIQTEHERISVRGLIGAPSRHRQNRTGQYLFVNRRPVVSPCIAFAVKDAYGTRLPSDRYPVFVLHIEIEADQVDVNVHPQKKEVRFREEGMIRRQIVEAIRNAAWPVQSILQQPIDWQEMNFRETFQENFVPVPSVLDSNFLQEQDGKSLSSLERNVCSVHRVVPAAASVLYVPSIGVFEHYLLINAQALYDLGIAQALFSSRAPEKGILYLDLLEATARITLEKWKGNKTIPSQGLLWPETVDISFEEEQLLALHELKLKALGFVWQFCGKQKILIEGIPSEIAVDEAGAFFKEWLAALQDSMIHPEQMLAHLPVKGRKKQFLLHEAEAIFQQVLLLPQEKPVVGFITLQEMRRKSS